MWSHIWSEILERQVPRTPLWGFVPKELIQVKFVRPCTRGRWRRIYSSKEVLLVGLHFPEGTAPSGLPDLVIVQMMSTLESHLSKDVSGRWLPRRGPLHLKLFNLQFQEAVTTCTSWKWEVLLH